MKIYNFQLLKRTGTKPTDWFFEAKVTVEKGFWIFKTTEEKVVCKNYADFWRYKDTGKFAELTYITEAEKVFEFEHGKIEQVRIDE